MSVVEDLIWVGLGVAVGAVFVAGVIMFFLDRAVDLLWRARHARG